MTLRPLAPRWRLVPFAVLAAGLSACSGDDEAASVAVEYGDPLMDGALAERLLTDTDLVDINGANQLASLGVADGALPRPDVGVDAATAAREEAMALIGGASARRQPPAPEEVDGQVPPVALVSLAARAAWADAALGPCAQAAAQSAMWAARMPTEFPVYPRAAVIEAAGSDAGNCHYRAVHFVSAVGVADVLAFYHTRAATAGLTVGHQVQDGESGLIASNGEQRLLVYARPAPGGGTAVDLLTAGR